MRSKRRKREIMK